MDFELQIQELQSQTLSNQNDVMLALAKHLIISTEARHSNSLFSPLSINIVLGLIAAGLKGPAQDQLLDFLKAKSIDDLNSLCLRFVNAVLADGSLSGGPLLSFANGVWVDQSLSLKPSFERVINHVYNAASNHVDFQNKAVEVTKEVNLWAEKGTRGLIKEILPPGSVDSTTRIVLGNALYFKGTWKKKFDASKTKEHEFHLLDGRSIQVPFMTSNKKQHLSAFDGFKVLRLPYAKGEDKRSFSMYIYLPDAMDGLPALIERMVSEPGFLENYLPAWEAKVENFLIPKFKISFGFEASKVLKQLGLVLPFSGEGITEMVDYPAVGQNTQNLCVSCIFHKSFVDVNEEGAEAAAATVGLIKLCYVEEIKLDFVADHPFLFLIQEDITGMVLFIGSVMNPSVC